MSERGDPVDIERRFRAICESGGIEQPDEVDFDPIAGEIVFLWTEEKFAVVVDLNEQSDGPLVPPI